MRKIWVKGGPDKPTKARFYEYSQNNSGGRFRYEKEDGLGHYVIVEAANANQANSIAQDIGLYFDGYGDCSCCGDRWYEKWDDDDGDEVPSHYGKPLAESEDDYRLDHREGEPYIFVHYLDGTIEGWE